MNTHLDKAGAYTVEQVANIPDYAGLVDLASPPKGVLHTTEGSWDGALSVFQKHYAPHFMVGRGRIAQLLPLGHAAAALEHPSGPPTNGVCRAQIEIVGHSLHSPWLPDTETLDALASLLAELETVAGIPLTHVAPARNARRFAAASGWMGHVDIPGNVHWDPGALKWQAVLDAAAAKQARVPAGPVADPGVSAEEWAWRQWAFGEGKFKGHAPFAGKRPGGVPNPVPVEWHVRAIEFLIAREQK